MTRTCCPVHRGDILLHVFFVSTISVLYFSWQNDLIPFAKSEPVLWLIAIVGILYSVSDYSFFFRHLDFNCRRSHHYACFVGSAWLLGHLLAPSFGYKEAIEENALPLLIGASASEEKHLQTYWFHIIESTIVILYVTLIAMFVNARWFVQPVVVQKKAQGRGMQRRL